MKKRRTRQPEILFHASVAVSPHQWFICQCFRRLPALVSEQYIDRTTMHPRIPVSGREDTQPNERRLDRKGVANVPTIRLTTPRRTGRGAFQGRTQGYRGSGTSYSNRVPQTFSHASAASNPSRYASRGRFNSDEQYSSARTHPGGPSRYPSARYSPTTSTAPHNSSKRLPSFPDVRQSKRPRLANSSDTPSQSRLDRPPAPSPNPTKKQTTNSRVEVRLDIPLYCRTGVHGYRTSRRRWLDREIQRIEQERKVKVCNTQYLDREVLLYCSAEEFQNFPVGREPSGDFSYSYLIRPRAKRLLSQTSRTNA
jgi:hypothetical protein